MLAAALASDRAKPLEREVQRMRLVKSAKEMALMKNAADLSASAHAKVCSPTTLIQQGRSRGRRADRQVMRFAKAGGTENALAAHFEYQCTLEGAERPAYVPVVASG